MHITVNAAPDYALGGQLALCDGQTAVLSVIPHNFLPEDVSYTWYYNDELQADVTTGSAEIIATGTYKVIVSNALCSTEKEITIGANSNPFTLLPHTICTGDVLRLYLANADSISNIESIEWSGPGGFTYSGISADITGLPEGEYNVTVTTTDGCSATVSLTVDNTTCIVQRGVSPGNGDSLNNSFDLSNQGDVQRLEIFDRYGITVYQKENYVNEWHGQSDRGDLANGTYYYVISLKNGQQKTGWLYLMKESK